MSSGGGGGSQTTSNAPPQEYLDAYKQVLGRATDAANAPYQDYPGQLQAGFSPQQNQAFNLVGSTVGMQAPYINAAAQDFTNATDPLQPKMQPYVDQAQGYYQNAAGSNLQGAMQPYQQAAERNYNALEYNQLGSASQPYLNAAQQGFGQVGNTNLTGAVQPWQQQAAQGFSQGSKQLNPDQYSANAVNQYYNPYQKAVVDATQKQFDLSNATQQAQLQGNAASQGALGGDRVGVAQAQLAGQQMAQQAPVIAGLQNQGFAQAQQEFNNQQQTKLSAQQQSQAMQQQAAQGYLGIGNQSLTAAQQQAALKAQAATGMAGLGNQYLSAQQAQLAAQGQAAQGFAGLAGQSMTAAQQQAQLYNQAGQGVAQLGQNVLGAGQAQGWLNAQAGSGMAGLGNQALSGTLASANALSGTGAQQQQYAQQGLNTAYQQWQARQSYPFQTTGWLSNIAQGLGGASGTTSAGPSTGSQLAGLGTIAGAGALYGAQNGWFGGGATATDMAASNAAAAAGSAWGGATDAGFTAAANSGLGAIYKRGGPVRGFAGGGGVPDVSVNGLNIGAMPGSQSVLTGGNGVPDVSASVVPTSANAGGTPFLKRDWGHTTTSEGSGDSTFGSLVKTGLSVAASIYGTPAAGIATNAALSGVHFGKGGHVPSVSRGFAAGGAPIISVTTVPNSRGVGVPTLNFDPTANAAAAQAPTLDAPAGGDASSPLNTYLNQTAAGAYHYKPPPPPADAPAAAAPKPENPNGPSDGVGTPQGWTDMDWRAELLRQNSPGAGARGGTVQGFDAGGDVGDDWTPPSADFGTIDNQPVGQRLMDYLRGRSRDSEGQAVPEPPVPPSDRSDRFSTPLAKQIPGFIRSLIANQQAQDDAFKLQTGGYDEMMKGRGVDPTIANPDAGEPPPDLADIMNGFGQGREGRGAGDHTYPVPPPPSETHGGGWQPGVALPDEPASTPAGPARTTTNGGFGANGPPGPATPPPASNAAPTSSGFTADRDRMAAERERYFAADEAKSSGKGDYNALLSLAIAGAGMMAGKSPHAMTNIGEGALAGLGNYVKTSQAAKELAARVEENKARLAETSAYHNITGGIAQQNANTKAAAQSATAAYKAFQMANPKATQASLMQKTVDYLVGTEGLNQDQAWARVKGLDLRADNNAETARSHRANEGLAGDRIEIARQHLMNTDQYQQQVLLLRQQGLDQARIDNIMGNATRNVVGDPAGRLTLDAAVKAQTASRGMVANQGNPATPATPAGGLRAPTAEQLEQARAAIPAKGRDAVIQRMQAAGYDTSGL